MYLVDISHICLSIYYSVIFQWRSKLHGLGLECLVGHGYFEDFDRYSSILSIFYTEMKCRVSILLFDCQVSNTGTSGIVVKSLSRVESVAGSLID